MGQNWLVLILARGPKDLKRRLTGLGALEVLDDGVCTQLREVWERGPRPNEILIRPGFVCRARPLRGQELPAEIRDIPRPVLLRRPPLSILSQRSRGVGLRSALTLLFLAQADPGLLMGKGRILAPIEATTDNESAGLIDWIAVPAEHDVQSTGAITRKDNRVRQVKTALELLSGKDIQMTEFPSGGRGYRKFLDIRMQKEEGPRLGDPIPYTVPLNVTSPKVLSIPAGFFLNGWIHALTSGEIAAWLMFRHLYSVYGPTGPPEPDGSIGRGQHISGYDRLVTYDLTKACWNNHSTLTDFGLLDFEADERRHENGTVDDFGDEDSSTPERHRFQLVDDALSDRAVPLVMARLENPERGLLFKGKRILVGGMFKKFDEMTAPAVPLRS